MDYYQVLRVAPNASRKEIDQAYQRLLKESRYDTSINRLQIENAYKILSDLASKSQYDARQTIRTKRTVRIKNRKLPSIGIVEWIKRRTLPQLLAALGIALCIAIVFYAIRYGYLLKQFHAGDMLYENITRAPFGKVLKVEENHPFGSKQIDAYQVELHPSTRRFGTTENVVWLPQDNVKLRCYKLKNPE